MNKNGYVIYPGGVTKMDLDDAKRAATEQSTLAENEYRSRVEDCDSEQIVARFRNGEEQ